MKQHYFGYNTAPSKSGAKVILYRDSYNYVFLDLAQSNKSDIIKKRTPLNSHISRHASIYYLVQNSVIYYYLVQFV